MIPVYCINIGEEIHVEGGVQLMQLAVRLADRLPFTPICAHVNNKTENLSYCIYAPKQIEFLDADTPVGRRVYVRSLCMLLYRAVREVVPAARLRIEHSVSGGYLCNLFGSDGRQIIPDAAMIDSLLSVMRSLVERNLPFDFKEAPTEQVTDIFRAQGLDSKVRLLASRGELYTSYYTLDGVADSYYSALAPTTGFIRIFDLRLYHEGFLLLGPDPVNKDVPRQPVTQEKMFEAYKKHLLFNRTIKVSDVGELNHAIQCRHTAELINVAEAMHESFLSDIASDIARRNRDGGGKGGAACRAIVVGQDHHYQATGSAADDQAQDSEDDIARRLFLRPRRNPPR